MVQRRRSSSEDRLSAIRSARSTSSSTSATATAGGAAPHIGNVRVTRIEHHQQRTLAAPSTTPLHRSRSPAAYHQTLGGSITDLSGSHVPIHHDIHHRRSFSASRDLTSSARSVSRDVATSSPRTRASSQDAFVVGYATVKTHERPVGSQGVNYKVFLNQVPIGGSTPHLDHELITAKPTPTLPRFDDTTAYTSYQLSPSYYVSTSNYLPVSHSPVSAYPSVSPYPVVSPVPYPSVSPYSYSSRRSRASRRSASLPRLYTSTTTARSYVPASPQISSTALKLMASDGPATSVESWTPWKSPRSAATRQHDEDEFYRRLREIRLRAASPVADDLDLIQHRLPRGRAGRPVLAFSPNVIYTGKKIDYGLIPERPVPPPPSVTLPPTYSTYVDDNPSRYHDFEPTDVGVVVLPNGQRAVTYTRQSQTGHGDHRQANVEIEKIIKKTKHLQDSMHTLEEFVRRNRSLFPEDIIIYQNIKFFRLTEEELRRIGERPGAEVYGVKIREKLVVPYGTEVIDILRKHYSRYRDVEVEYEDLEQIRRLAASAEKTQLPTKDSIRKVVEAEYEDLDRQMVVPARPPAPARVYVPSTEYMVLRTLESLETPKRTPADTAAADTMMETTSRRQTFRTISEGRPVGDAGESLRPPLEFTSKLRNRHITEGNSVRLSCALNVTPDTVVTWHHGPNVVRESDNHHMSVGMRRVCVSSSTLS